MLGAVYNCVRDRRGVELHRHIKRISNLNRPRLLFSTSVIIILFLNKRDYSFEHNTALKHPEFRTERFPSAEFRLSCLEKGAVMFALRMVEVPKYTSHFRLSTGHFCRAALAIFTQQTAKNRL